MGIFNDQIITKQKQKQNLNFINNIDYAIFILDLAIEYPSSKIAIFRRKLLNRNMFDTSANIKEYLVKQKGILSFNLFFYSPHNNNNHSFFRILGSKLQSLKSNTEYKFIILFYTYYVGINNLLQITARVSTTLKNFEVKYLENNKFTLFNLQFTTVNKNDLVISINLIGYKSVKDPQIDPQLTTADRICIFYAELSEIY